jgi:hypothetical protein
MTTLLSILNPIYIRNLVQKTSSLIESQFAVYVGDPPIQLLNDDGFPCFAKTITVADKQALAIDPSLEITTILYSVLLASEIPPDSGAIYWISNDEGITKKRVKFYSYVPKTGFFRLLLQAEG